MATILGILFSVSRSLRNASSMRQVQVFHQKVISFGFQRNMGMCKNLIDHYIKLGEYLYADSVFRSIETPLDITLWNGLMAAYAKSSMFVEGILLFEGLLQFPYLKPDGYTYPSLLKACGGLRKVDYGEKVHGRLTKEGYLSDIVIASALINVYAKCCRFFSAVKVFDEMQERDLACWNNVMSCYYQSGQYEKALDYFERMKHSGLSPDSVSFTAAISSCARLLDKERGRMIHEEVLRSGLEFDSFVSAALVDMYGKTGCLMWAKRVFDLIKDKSLVTWNAMIGSYSHIGDTVSCMELLVRMTREDVRPTSETIGSLLVSCAKSAQLRHGRFVHGFVMRNYMFHDIYVHISFLDFYFKCGCVETAEKLFRMLPESNIVSWNVMISGYVSAGLYLKALATFDDMRESGIQPDEISVTSALAACSQMTTLERVKEAECIFKQLPTKDLVSWTSMIVAYGSHGRALDALNLFDQMVHARVRPDRIAFLAVISACSHGGLVDQGLHYFNRMVDDYKITPTTAEYSCVIDLLGRAGRLHEAYNLLLKPTSMKEDPDLLSTLLAACSMNGDIELGDKIGNLLLEKDPDDQSTYTILEKMYASAKRFEKKREIRSRMKELGLKKNHGCSWIEVDEKIQSFVAADKAFAEAESTYRCLSLLHTDIQNDHEMTVQGAGESSLQWFPS